MRVRTLLTRMSAVHLVLDEVAALTDAAVRAQMVHADAAAGVVSSDEEAAGRVDGEVGGLRTAGLAAAELSCGHAVGEKPCVHAALVDLGDRVEHRQAWMHRQPRWGFGGNHLDDLITIEHRDARAVALVSRVTADQHPGPRCLDP